MRIAYVVPFQEGQHVGVERMSRTKVDLWRDLGVDAHLVLIPSAAEGTRVDRVRARYLGWPQRLRDVDADVVYLRHGGTDPALALAIGRRPTVLEVHAASTTEATLSLVSRSRLSLGLHLDLRLARGAIFVADRVAGSEAFARIARHAVIPNGALLGPISPAPENDIPRVGLIIGSASPWHGIDRVSELAAQLPNASITIIHPEAVTAWVHDQVPPARNIELRPTTGHEDYLDALRDLDVGIGPLALDRWSGSDTTPLKVVDLVATGVPLVLPYTDTTFSRVGDDPAVLAIGTYERMLGNADDLRAFVAAAPGTRLKESTRRRADLRDLEARRIDLIQTWTR